MMEICLKKQMIYYFLLICAATFYSCNGSGNEMAIDPNLELAKTSLDSADYALKILNKKLEELEADDAKNIAYIKSNIMIIESNKTILESLRDIYSELKDPKSEDKKDAKVELITQVELLNSQASIAIAIGTGQGLSVGTWAQDPTKLNDSIVPVVGKSKQ
jgi:hypothetical protein